MNENILKRFNRLFKIEGSKKNEQNSFVQRINQTIFKDIEWYQHYEEMFRDVCYRLSKNPDDIMSHKFRQLSNDNFFKTIKILMILYNYFKNEKDLQDKISLEINKALSYATVDIGIRWKNGIFYPSGAKILDEKLIEDPFDWLNEFPDEKKDFETALSHYISKDNKKLGDVVSNCYLVVEGLARKILNNKKTLDNNKELLFKKLKLSQSWKSLLSNYINYANKFKRHASDERHSINPPEVEAFLYITGLLTRLIIQNYKV